VSRLQRKNRILSATPGLPSRALLRLGVALALLLVSLPLPAQNSTTPEYRAKASYLAKFPSFVEWPEGALPPKGAPSLLCVFGEYPFGVTLAESTRGATVHERRIETHWISKEQELRACQVLFVSRSEQKRYSRVLEAVSGQMVLTVGETPEFLAAGGIVTFSMQQSTLQFEVNLDEAHKAHLKISSRLLALARHVVNRTEAAKS
jgi:YfiR/HmsC-like